MLMLICFGMASLIAQCTSKMVNVSQERCPCVCFDEVSTIAIKSNINRDDGNFVKTNTWIPLLRNINNIEIVLRNQRSHCKANMMSN